MEKLRPREGVPDPKAHSSCSRGQCLAPRLIYSFSPGVLSFSFMLGTGSSAMMQNQFLQSFLEGGRAEHPEKSPYPSQEVPCTPPLLATQPTCPLLFSSILTKCGSSIEGPLCSTLDRIPQELSQVLQNLAILFCSQGQQARPESQALSPCSVCPLGMGKPHTLQRDQSKLW